MMKTKRTGRRGEAGFSLVEVTLALLVVAVGLTATLALFPEGLTATREAVNNTETALFADYVFSTLELSAAYQSHPKVGVGNVKEAQLTTGTKYFISLMFSDNAEVEIDTSGNTATFYWMPHYYGLDSGDMKSDYFQGKLVTAVFTYQLKLDLKEGNGSPFRAVLKVWPGEFDKKSEMNSEDARIFYREILPPL